MPRLLLCITGGIAAYKAPSLVRLFVKRGHEVRCVLTRAALPLVGITALQTVSGNPVYSDDLPAQFDMDHIRLSEWADMMLVAPATANTIAKFAHGIADNLVSTLALSVRCKIVIAPAMNTVMWDKPVTQSNLGLLRDRGFFVLPVGVGELACGDSGAGRMIFPESIVEYVACAQMPKLLAGKKVLIASGPTQEAIDPVRILTNKSSGRMGASLAAAALAMGADVTVVSGPAEVLPPEGVKRIDVESALQMHDELHSHFANADITIMAAAVADYRPARYSENKLARTSEMTIELQSNPDIAASLGEKKRNDQTIVCFALETGSEDRAVDKMRKKKCDLMVFNKPSDSLGTSDTSAVILLTDGSREEISGTKTSCAQKILSKAVSMLSDKTP